MVPRGLCYWCRNVSDKDTFQINQEFAIQKECLNKNNIKLSRRNQCAQPQFLVTIIIIIIIKKKNVFTYS